jgi:hypothetical protein
LPHCDWRRRKEKKRRTAEKEKTNRKYGKD